jgi:hypothetical protein
MGSTKSPISKCTTILELKIPTIQKLGINLSTEFHHQSEQEKVYNLGVPRSQKFKKGTMCTCKSTTRRLEQRVCTIGNKQAVPLSDPYDERRKGEREIA